MKKRVPQIYLEQLYLNELSSEKAASISDQPLDELVRGIEASNMEILDQYSPSFIKDSILRKLNSEKEVKPERLGFRSNILKFAPIAAALIFLTLNLTQAGRNIGQGDIIRPKGLTPNLSVYIDNGNAPVELFTNDFVSNSDVLQLTYNSAGNRYGVIFSIDGRGVITLHYPENKDAKPSIDPNGSHALPFSYELDDAPGFERFFFISSDREFNVSTVLKSAEKTIKTGGASTIKALDLPSGFDQESILLRKDF